MFFLILFGLFLIGLVVYLYRYCTCLSIYNYRTRQRTYGPLKKRQAAWLLYYGHFFY